MNKKKVVKAIVYIVGFILYLVFLAMVKNKFGEIAWMYTFCVCIGMGLFIGAIFCKV